MASVSKSLLTEFKARSDYNHLTMMQQEFFNVFFSKRNIFLTGPAGTGKSYCLNALFSFLDEKEIFYGKTATTGVAAINIGGTTIHAWSGMGLGDAEGMQLLDKVEKNRKAKYRIKNAKVLVIDEISMATATLLEKLDICCQYIRNNGKPFGGIQVIFTGDFLQLPPVFNKFEEEVFAFESTAWREANVLPIHLTEIVRQHDDPDFATFLNEIRTGNTKNFHMLKECENRSFPDDGIQPVKLFCKNINVDDFNAQELNKIKSNVKIYRAVDTGGDGWTSFFDKNCKAPAELKLKVGAQVMLIKNIDVSEKLVNGSVGVVEGLQDEFVIVKFTDGKTQVIEPQTWEMRQNEDDGYGNMISVLVASRTQIPLRLAWAVTVHKSQGSTLDRAEVDIADAFASGQVYVALSRVRNLKSLKIKSYNPSAVIVNKKCIEFYKERKKVEAEFFEL
jgi:ATP-dependent exoDNAse (exonuclease V) alpha subunit